MSSIRVRFAPSPTGTLHVGGARTALFNWLYARAQKGTFVLRIEDTDQERSTEESHQQILRAMDWLGLDYDEGPGKGGDFGPYIQSERLLIYKEYTQRLLDEGLAYKDYSTPEEDVARKKKLEEKGVLSAEDWPYRNLTADQQAEFEAQGRVATIRVQMPDEGVIRWTDLVHGDMEFQYAVLEDWVAVKSDGFPTYNFACVVDDGLMEISHVLRGDDHVSNTPRQIHLFKALGLRVPKFGHMPMILGPDKKRLSKRHGAASVEEFRDGHWLSEAVVNYLALLGWSSGNDQEFFTVQQIIKKFSLKRLNNTAAVFDYEKARHLNGEHMKAMKPAQKVELAFDVLRDAGVLTDEAEKARLGRILALLGNRFAHFDRAVPHLSAYFCDDYPVDAEVAVGIDDAARTRLNALADRYESLDPFDAAGAEQALRELATESGEKAGAFIHPARFAISGSGSGPSLFDAMQLLGQELVVRRLRAPRMA
ncbi:glutamate--tRNA ligase [bacterium]|nr:MAG: glutamate--tRNA ligase [bacterium]RKZ16635.1 MAG: glutamate--tRNA ligase [bacterium]